MGDLNLLHAPSLLTDCNDMIKTGAYPVSITYDVDTDHTATCPLKCSIEVTGADRPLKYVVTATLPCKKGGLVCEYFLTLEIIYTKLSTDSTCTGQGIYTCDILNIDMHRILPNDDVMLPVSISDN